MRIVLISGEYPPRVGGVADYTCHLAHALARLGHRVSVLTSSRGDDDKCAVEDDTQVDVHADVREWGVRGFAAISRGIRNLAPDVVNFQYVPHMYGRGGFAPGAALLPLRLRRVSNARIVCTLHEVASPWTVKPRRALQAAAHWTQAALLLAASHRCVVTNPRYARQLRRWPGRRSAVHEIPVGASIQPATISAAGLGSIQRGLAARDGHTLGELSALGVGKRPGDLIAILSALGCRAHLALLGGLAVDEHRHEWFMEQAAKAGVAERVKWSGVLPPADLSSTLSLLDVYVHTHDAGASTRSTTLASALAHGLPVAAYRGPETSSIFADGENILLAPRGDVRALSERVCRLLESPELRARLSRGARALYLQHLTWDSIARRFLDAAS